MTGAAPVAVSAPAGALTPFGFSVYGDGTALITLAHSSQDGLFGNGAFASVTDAGQSAPAGAPRVENVFTSEEDHQSRDRHNEIGWTKANALIHPADRVAKVLSEMANGQTRRTPSPSNQDVVADVAAAAV